MSWNRWTEWVLRGLVAVAMAGLVGCKQQLFLEPGDYQDAVKSGLPKGLETHPHDAIVPPVVARVDKGPATVLDPARPPRYITLKECVAIALEQGNIGSRSPTNFGFKNEQVAQFTGQSVGGTDAIRAFALDPAIIGTNIERSLSKFDARWITSMSWQKVDQPVAAQFIAFQQQRDAANFSTTLAKPLPTGGVAGITFSVDYSKFPNQVTNQFGGFVNPNYTPRLQFVFEQPLLQLFGVEVNQLTSQHPGSSLIQGLRPSGGQGVEGILITRIRFDQSRAEFEGGVQFQLVNVETAYWNLYASYYNLYAQEEGLRQSFDGYRFTRARVETGIDPPQTLNQARAQFELFRAQVYQARGQVLEAERQLRGLLGLRSDDGYRLVPIDEPNTAPFEPDFYEAANEAVALRPELMLARQEVKAQQLNLLLQKNLRRPDLRFFSSYDIAGLGTRLDGQELVGPNNTIPGNAFASLGNNQFNSWTLGLRLDMPLGFRDANALVRQNQLQMTRSYYQLRDAELRVLEQVTLQYRRLVETYAQIPPLRSRREQLQIYVDKVKQVIAVGKWTSTEFFNYLQVQRDLADAIRAEFQAIANYNSALAQFEFAKGTVLRYNNVSLNEGPLPPHVHKRAADHIRERTEAAIKLRERPAVHPGPGDGHSVGPAVGTPFVQQLPPFAEKRDPLPEQLPDPRPADPKDGPKDTPPPMPNPPGMNPPGNPAARPVIGSPVSVDTNPAPATLPGPTRVPGADPAAIVQPQAYFQPQGTVSLPPSRPIHTGAAPRPTPAGEPGPVPAPPGGGLSEVPPLPGGGGSGVPTTDVPPLPAVGVPALPKAPER